MFIRENKRIKLLSRNKIERMKAKKNIDIFMSMVEKKKTEPNEDTVNRKKIHKFIIDSIALGATDDQIINLLNEKIENNKYSEFYESWIKHQREKNPVAYKEEMDSKDDR